MFPASAQAEDFCVGSHPDCPVGATIETQDMAGFFDSAVGANTNAGSDRIYVAADTYVITSGMSVGFTDDVEIRGEGVGQTIFTSSISGQDFLNFGFPSSASFIEGFSIEASSSHVGSTGLDISGGGVREFGIYDQSAGGADNFTGLALNDGATASSFEIELESDGVAVSASDGSATIDQATILGPSASGTTGIKVDNLVANEVKVTRSTVRAFRTGFLVRSGRLTASDILVDLETVSLADAFYLFDDLLPESDIDVSLDRVTVHGNAVGHSGVFFGADNGFTAKTFVGTIKDSVIELAGANAKAFRCIETVDDSAAMTISNVAYDHTFPITNFDPGCVITASNNIDLAGQPSQFEDAPTDNFTPATGSLLIDAGSDGSSLPLAAVDLAGNARLNDGDGNCIANLDLGAFETQLPTPPQCVPPATPPATPPTTPPVTTPLATAKLTTRAKKAFIRSRSGFRKRTNPRATAFGVTYKNAQVARFEIEQVLRGVKKGKTCKRGSKGGKRCTFYKKIPGIQRQDVFDGEIFYQFGGQIGGKKLKPGNYRVIITPFGEGAVMGTPLAVPFKLK